MKRKIILAATLCVCAIAAEAQTNLNALMKRCESIDKVDVEVVSTRNTKTKKLEKSIVTVTFSTLDCKGLNGEFLEAFKKDKEDASRVMESKVNGKLVPSCYIFTNGDTNTIYTYGSSGVTVSITSITNYEENKEEPLTSIPSLNSITEITQQSAVPVGDLTRMSQEAFRDLEQEMSHLSMPVDSLLPNFDFTPMNSLRRLHHK